MFWWWHVKAIHVVVSGVRSSSDSVMLVRTFRLKTSMLQAALFLEPNQDCIVECLESCCSAATPPRYNTTHCHVFIVLCAHTQTPVHGWTFDPVSSNAVLYFSLFWEFAQYYASLVWPTTDSCFSCLLLICHGTLQAFVRFAFFSFLFNLMHLPDRNCRFLYAD